MYCCFLYFISDNNPLPCLALQLEPYFMRSRGETRYEGYLVDLVQRVADIVPFDFTWRIQKGFGKRQKDGEPTGMIGDLLTGVSRALIIKIKYLWLSEAFGKLWFELFGWEKGIKSVWLCNYAQSYSFVVDAIEKPKGQQCAIKIYEVYISADQVLSSG